MARRVTDTKEFLSYHSGTNWICFGIDSGLVMIDMEKGEEIGFTPAQARRIGNKLIKFADMQEGK